MSKWKEEFNIMAKKMDLREDFLSKLYKMFPNFEDCPPQYQDQWKAYEKDGFKNWRNMPKVVRRIKRAAKKKCSI